MKRKPMATTVALECLGCKLNQAETELLEQQLSAAGYTIVSPEDRPDIYILNTCTVTHIADRKSRHMLRLAQRRNPHGRIVVTGCYAERAPRELEKIDGIELIAGNAGKSDLVRLLGMPEHDTAVITLSPHHVSRTRAFIKIQDGCHNFCSYCIVPLVRRREESVPAAQVIAEINQKVAAGYREVVLTGTEVGSYRDDDIDLKRLLGRILDETKVSRLRLSSLQPPEISTGLIALWRDDRLCPHFHLSLQSGSDTVLKRMKRRYTTDNYSQAVSFIRQNIPDVAITTDVIAGFPGETEAEFQESYDFCRGAKFSRIHVFPFSPRPGTAAARMPSDVNDKVKKQRSTRMLDLAGESAGVFHQTYCGRTMLVLWEKKDKGLWSGLTGNYIRVYTASKRDLTNQLLPVKLLETFKDGVRAEEIT